MDIFKERFKNYLAFLCCVSSLNDDINDIIVMEVDYDYIIEKYKRYIAPNTDIDDMYRNNILLLAHSIKKFKKADSFIDDYEKVFGIGSFNNITISPNYESGLHNVLRDKIFDVYMKNIFPYSRKYKIWKVLNN